MQHKDEARKQDSVRLVVLSDTHGCHELLEMPVGDVLIHCGDFTDRGSLSIARDFLAWISKVSSSFAEVLIIDGNHDRNLKDPNALDLDRLFSHRDLPPNIHYLKDQMYVSEKTGLTVYGASWDTTKTESGLLDSALEASNKDVDIVLVHLNPCIHRETAMKQVGRHVAKAWLGSKQISHAVLRHKIPLCLSGHVHYGRGAIMVEHDLLDATDPHQENAPFNWSQYTWFVNASSLQGLGVAKPVVIDFDVTSRRALRIQCENHAGPVRL